MRLLHITATHLNPAGGVPVVLKNLVEEQNKITGFEARVLSLTAKVNNMDSIYFDILDKNTFKKYLEKYNPNVVILHSFFYMAYNNVVNELVKMKIPYFIEPHGSFGNAAMHKSHLKKIIANSTIFRKQIKCAKGFIFLNESELEDSIYRTKNDLIIPNGISIKDMNRQITTTRKPFMYFIGRYDINHKGLDYLISALEILEARKKNFKVVFWGNGEDDAIAGLKEKISLFKHVEVEFNGPIFGEDKDKELEMCGPMLLTSRYEGFPMTILEAWKYGNPCLVTPGTNVYKEICKNKLGWGVDLNADSIANGIEKAIVDYEQDRNNYITRCKDYVAKNYTWSSIAVNSLDKIRKVVGC